MSLLAWALLAALLGGLAASGATAYFLFCFIVDWLGTSGLLFLLAFSPEALKKNPLTAIVRDSVTSRFPPLSLDRIVQPSLVLTARLTLWRFLLWAGHTDDCPFAPGHRLSLVAS